MNAETFLVTLQRHDELFDSLLAFVPPNTGGSNLNETPPWMSEQLRVIGLKIEGPPWKMLRRLFEQIDWAKGELTSILSVLPEDTRSLLQIGDAFAVGCIHSAEFNGAVYEVPDSHGRVLVLPFGAKLMLENIATLVTVHVSPSLYRMLIRGGHQSLGYREGWPFRLNRFLFQGAGRRVLGRRYPKNRVGSEMFLLFRRYSLLGVADPSDVARDLIPLPLLGDIRRVTHPLEPGAFLAWAAIRFLVLHECAHILLGHRTDCKEHRLTQELEADREALRLALLTGRTEAAKCLSCLGAWMFILCAEWLERTEHNKPEQNHPTPRKRMEALKNFLMEKENAPFSSNASSLIDQLDRQFSELWIASEWMRSDSRYEWNSLDLLLERCANEQRADAFVDQFARWVLFGIPQRLCRTTAKIRHLLESKLKEDPSDKHAHSKLEILMQAYTMAERVENSSLAQELERAYGEEVVNTN